MHIPVLLLFPINVVESSSLSGSSAAVSLFSISPWIEEQTAIFSASSKTQVRMTSKMDAIPTSIKTRLTPRAGHLELDLDPGSHHKRRRPSMATLVSLATMFLDFSFF